MFPKIQIDTALQTPVYKQIIERIEEFVNNGKYPEGTLLPSMNELSAELDISKETVKKAYSVLRDRNIIDATQGKGFYVSPRNSSGNPRILVLFDKLSTYKQVLFSSFSAEFGNEAEISIRLHNQHVDMLEYFIEENIDKFDYYVITPHFPLDKETQKRVIKALSRIPNRKLILVDRYIKNLPGNYGAVYQDFVNDVATGLSQGLKKLKKCPKLNVITLSSSLYAPFIEQSVEKFCNENGIPVEFHSMISPDIVRNKEVYLILNSQLDTELIKLVKTAWDKEFKIGRDISIISYNESPINEIILNGLTVISTDFTQMGELAARMIKEKSLTKVRCDFNLIRRKTF